MDIRITSHARHRMLSYNISEDQLNDVIERPDSISDSYGNRKIYQKRTNAHVIRAIVEEGKDIKIVVTTYKAKSERYEI